MQSDDLCSRASRTEGSRTGRSPAAAAGPVKRVRPLPTLTVLVVCLLIGVAGCAPAKPPPAYVKPQAHPPLGNNPTLVRVENTFLPVGVYQPFDETRLHEVVLQRGGRRTKLWIYRPHPLRAARVPCVLIAPAGTPLLHGIGLATGDQREHYPYVKAGMVVVAYELDGSLPQSGEPSDTEMLRAAGEFMAAQAGLRNAQDALDYALANVPEIDPQRIYTAGHSSAATAALHVAQHEPRIAAAAAFAPCTDVEGRLGGAVSQLDRRIKGYGEFIRASSPLRNSARLRCPVFLFHADDDDNVPVTETQKFAAEVGKTNPNVTLHRAPTGGHYDSMIQQGVPQAISWMLQLPNVRGWRPVPVELRAAHPGAGPGASRHS